MQKRKNLQMQCRRLWSSYRCHRHRGKSHFQITLELLAKLTSGQCMSTRLMQISLKHHNIRDDLKLADVLNYWDASKQYVQCGEILSGRFFVNVRDQKLWEIYQSQFGKKVQTVIEDAEAICRHEFDLLGSGLSYLGDPIDWHVDPVSGHRWPKKFSFEINLSQYISTGIDDKFPWELSRMQHLPTLGKAYRITKNERYAREIVEQLTHWMDDNPCPYGVNWTCAMDVAIRIMNITWAYLFIEDAPSLTNDFRTRLAISIFQHGQFILFNLEYGIQEDGSIVNGNHYLTNIVGLLHLGLTCPEFATAETWRHIGVAALVEEMDRQVHRDGGDFESSIPYHRLVLELFSAGALLCQLNGAALPPRFWKRLETMFEFVLFVTRPDGKVPQVGDADDGRLYILSDYSSWDRTDFRYLLAIGSVLFQRSDMKANSNGFSEEAFWLLGPSSSHSFNQLVDGDGKLNSKAFRDSGLYVMRTHDKYLLACCGVVGARGVSSHKHNDLLSFELYAGDKALIVDPGAYVYARNPVLRGLFRSTNYHNSVVIDGQEQNRFDVRRLFEMAADSTVIVHEWNSTPERDWLDVEHTGYTRLTRAVWHRRIFLFEKRTGTWAISDMLVGAGDHTADWYFHFDHGIEVEVVGWGRVRTSCEGTNLAIVARSSMPLALEIDEGWVSRRYGHRLPAKILHISGTFNSACRLTLALHVV
jgi:Heparinase II/III-like protein/Heparinase II/III N-terminus